MVSLDKLARRSDFMNKEEYKAAFAELPPDQTAPKEADTRAGRALSAALDIRKFEVDLYWKRATYFWAFIATAFAGYALTYKEHDPWISLLFSAFGLVFSFAWYLVNRGSKFWQNNWERHVDLLEDMTLGPLYEVVAENVESRNVLIASGKFSVTKINQMLSVFVTLVWLLLFIKSLGLFPDWHCDVSKVCVVALTLSALVSLPWFSRSTFGHMDSTLSKRTFDIKSGPSKR